MAIFARCSRLALVITCTIWTLAACDDQVADPAAAEGAATTEAPQLGTTSTEAEFSPSMPMGESDMQDGAGGDQAMTMMNPTVDMTSETDPQTQPTEVLDPDLPIQCTEPPPPPPGMNMNPPVTCGDPRGEARIKDLIHPNCAPFDLSDQDGDGFSDERFDVRLREVVVTGVFDTELSVQDPDGGPYSGLYLFTQGPPPSPQIQPGSRIRVSGELMEYYTLTELQVADARRDIEVLSQGPLPEPVYIADPGFIADNGLLTEQFESMLVEIRNVFVQETAPDCPREFDMFVVSGGLRIEDEVGLDYDPARGDFIERAAGILHYSFDHQKIRPPRPEDLETLHCGGRPDKCEATECSVENDAPETGWIVITEIQDNPLGRDSTREYVELFNPGNQPRDLAGWTLQNCAGRSAPLVGTVEAGGRYVVGGDGEGDDGGANTSHNLGDLALSNGEGSLLLFNTDGRLVDQVRYSRDGNWPSRDNGYSLELVDPNADNRNGSAWRVSSSRYGDGGWGSPGLP